MIQKINWFPISPNARITIKKTRSVGHSSGSGAFRLLDQMWEISHQYYLLQRGLNESNSKKIICKDQTL